MKMKKRILLLVLTVLAVASAYAHEGGCEVRNRLKSEKIGFLTERLELTPDEAAEFWPVYNACWDEMKKANHCRRDALKKIDGMISGKAAEDELKDAVNDYMECLDNEAEAMRLLFEKVQPVIGTERASMLFVLEEEFKVNLMVRMRKGGMK